MTTVTKIEDLFKVYTLWDEYIYIEQLRPLTEEDFELATDKMNSLLFITESKWSYSTVNKRAIAKIGIKLRHEEEILACIPSKLSDTNLEELKKLFDPSKTNITFRYSYAGCPNGARRKEREDQARKELESEVAKHGDTKLEYLYESATKKVEDNTRKTSNLNYDYQKEIKRVVEGNSTFHSSIKKDYDEAASVAVDAIESLRKEISDCEDKIKSLSEIVGIEHRRLVALEIETWDDTPLNLLQELKEMASKLNLYGCGGRHSFRNFNDNSIYIRKGD